MLQTLAVDISTTILTVLAAFALTTHSVQVKAGQDLAIQNRVPHI
jgi:hypothetical protein